MKITRATWAMSLAVSTKGITNRLCQRAWRGRADTQQHQQTYSKTLRINYYEMPRNNWKIGWEKSRYYDHELEDKNCYSLDTNVIKTLHRKEAWKYSGYGDSYQTMVTTYNLGYLSNYHQERLK